ncbi:MAG: nicotinamide mononucleotide transporter [Bacteroidales bacterium]|nr:nicotinamide mononucleotide transporter [Bacteroidales bacterium]
MNWFEIIAALLAFAYVIFQILQKNLMWYLSIIVAIMYTALYLFNRMYAMAAVQFYLICVGVYGIIRWSRSRREAGSSGAGAGILIRPFERRVGVISIALAVAAFFLLHTILARTGDAAPWEDAFLSSVTMLAMYYTGRQYICSWLIFFVSDALSVCVYYYLGMYPTTILFVLYVAMALIGYFNWKRNGTYIAA